MFEATGAPEAFLLGRILFGGVLAFMGLNHFMDVDSMAEYAAYKGLPAPRLSVIGSGVVLVAGGLSIVAGVLPTVGGILLAGFLLISALTMHDFWSVEESETQAEMTNFLKNVFGAGAALAFVSIAGQSWPYAVNIGL